MSAYVRAQRSSCSPLTEDYTHSTLPHRRQSSQLRQACVSPLSPSLSAGKEPRTAHKLTCLEAIAAALIITGFDELADQLLSKFSWGHSFRKVNQSVPSSHFGMIRESRTCGQAVSGEIQDL